MNPYRIAATRAECEECISLQKRGLDDECKNCYNERLSQNYWRDYNLAYFDSQATRQELWLTYFLARR